jgi:hypothetical protein
MNDTIFTGLTHNEISLFLFINGFLSVDQIIKIRIEFENRVLKLATINN